MIEYPAKIKYDKNDNCYIVEFPDLPGCLTYGETIEAAQEMAVEALSGYLESIDLRKLDIPTPSKLKGKNIYYIAPEAKTAFAIWMKLTRIKKGLTQKKAAELLGINFQSYQKYENPKQANPTLTTLKKIEKVFNEKLVSV
jgi:antitoxin HicB